MVSVFREVRRVLRDDGTIWLNLGDTYIHKSLAGIPWRVAFALQGDGWYLRQDIIWHKPNPMPESVRDRCTKAHEYIFLLSKCEKYYFDREAMQEPAVKGAAGSAFHTGKTGDHQLGRSSSQPRVDGDTRNRRSVWTVPTQPFQEAHFATFPPDLIKPCILAGSPQYGTVIDPFLGSGTTALVAEQNDRSCIGIELNANYRDIAYGRLSREIRQQNEELNHMTKDLFHTDNHDKYPT